MQTASHHSAADTVTPFDWKRYTARETAASGKPVARATKAPGRPLSARARAERILAQRWGNPYCKPGAP